MHGVNSFKEQGIECMGPPFLLTRQKEPTQLSLSLSLSLSPPLSLLPPPPPPPPPMNSLILNTLNPTHRHLPPIAKPKFLD